MFRDSLLDGYCTGAVICVKAHLGEGVNTLFFEAAKPCRVAPDPKNVSAPLKVRGGSLYLPEPPFLLLSKMGIIKVLLAF